MGLEDSLEAFVEGRSVFCVEDLYQETPEGACEVVLYDKLRTSWMPVCDRIEDFDRVSTIRRVLVLDWECCKKERG